MDETNIGQIPPEQIKAKERYAELVEHTVSEISQRLKEKFGTEQTAFDWRHGKIDFCATEKIDVEESTGTKEISVMLGVLGVTADAEYFAYPHAIYNSEGISKIVDTMGGLDSEKAKMWLRWVTLHELSHFYLGTGTSFRATGVAGEKLTDEAGWVFIGQLYPELLTQGKQAEWKDIFQRYFEMDVYNIPTKEQENYRRERGLYDRMANMIELVEGSANDRP